MLGRLPNKHSGVSQCTYPPVDVSGRVTATWGRDALRHAIVATVLKAGQTSIKELPTIPDTLLQILLARIRHLSIPYHTYQLLQST